MKYTIKPRLHFCTVHVQICQDHELIDKKALKNKISIKVLLNN